MNLSQRTATPPRVQFIQDDPSADDLFGPHSATARAIATAILENPGLRTIGLLGDWGAGKSTVIRLLDNEWMELNGATAVRTFVFDAWLRHGEPLRRSFLEELLTFAERHALCERAAVKEALDRVTGRVVATETTEAPRVSGGGKAILTAFALFAVLSSQKAAIGGLPWIHTLLTFIHSRLAMPWLPPMVPMLIPAFTVLGVVLFRGIRRHRRGTERAPETLFDEERPLPEESLFSLLVTRKQETRHTRVTGNATPTALEFRDVYWRIVERIRANGVRLVIVVDNMDRIEPSDARELWGVLRTFFMSDGPIEVEGPAVVPPVVILPIATGAISVIHKNIHADAGAGFLEKTFDAVFYLPPPIFSDWHDYLVTRMRDALPGYASEANVLALLRLADDAYEGANRRVTPRIINHILNRIGAYCLVRDDDIPFATIAWYCLHKDLIDKDIIRHTSGDNPALDTRDSKWKEHTAALHFGVPVSDALPVLLMQPMRDAIDVRDAKRFIQLMEYPRAATLFAREVNAVSGRGGTSATVALSFLDLGVNTLLPPLGAPEIHLALARMLSAASAMNALSEPSTRTLQTAVRHAHPQARLKLIEAIGQLVAKTSPANGDFVIYFIQFWGMVEAEHPDLMSKIPAIPATSDIENFTKLAIDLQERPIIQRKLTPLQGTDGLAEQVANFVNPYSQTNADHVAAAITALTNLEVAIDWSPALQSAYSNIRQAGSSSIDLLQSTSRTGDALRLIAILMPRVDSVHNALAAEGANLHILLRAGGSAREPDMVGRVLGLIIAAGLAPIPLGGFPSKLWSDEFWRRLVDVVDETLRMALPVPARVQLKPNDWPGAITEDSLDVRRIVGEVLSRWERATEGDF